MWKPWHVGAFPVLLTAVGVLALCATPELFAEEPDPRPRVIVEHRGDTGAPEELGRVLTRAVEIELRRAQLQALPQSAPDEPDAPVPDDESLIERSEELESELFLSGTYSLSGRSLALDYRLIDVQDGELLAQGQRRGEVDLVVDRLVTDLLRELLSDVDERIAQLRESREEMVRVLTPEPPPEIPEGPELTEPMPADDSPEPRLRRLELGVGGNAFVAVGEFAPYLPYGYTAASTLLVWLGEGDFRIGIGGSAGYQRMIPAEEGFAEFIRTFVPIGVDLQFSVLDSNLISPRLILGGGAAIRIEDGSTASERLAAAIPYATAGLGVNLAVTNHFEIGVEAAIRSLFHIYRDDPDSAPEVEPIVGFSPGLRVSYRL